MNKLKLAIIGHSSNNSVTECAKLYANALVDFVNHHDCILCSGGCNGIIEYVNNAISLKDKILYYSPCKTLAEHNELYHLNMSDVTSNCIDDNISKDLNYNFIYRSLEMINDVDVVICFYGTWGTLGELDFAVMLGKKIIFVNENNRNQMLEIYKTIDNLSEYEYNERVYTPNTIEEFRQTLEKLEN